MRTLAPPINIISKKTCPLLAIGGIYRQMQELDDISLLREYVERHSEEAFAALVERHVNKVYSVALRHTRNPHSAEEITQAVFVILARKANHLGRKIILEGWLYETARLTAVTFIRSEIRRAHREQEAHMQTVLNENESAGWTQIAPELDAALAKLNSADRNAVVLRFFYDQSMVEIGAALGATEEGARKRVNRALEKLQKYFSKRGISSTTAILAGMISENSVHAAPMGLTKTISAVALAKGATTGSSTLTLAKGALKIMAWTKMKTAIVVGAVVLFAAGTTTVIVREIQWHKKMYSWEVPKANFGNFYDAQPQITIIPTKFAEITNGDWCSDGSRGALGIAVTLKEIAQIAYQYDSLHTVAATDLPTNRYDFLAKLVPARQPHKNIPINENWSVELQKAIAKKFGIKGQIEMQATDVLILKPSENGIHGFTISQNMPRGHKTNFQSG